MSLPLNICPRCGKLSLHRVSHVNLYAEQAQSGAYCTEHTLDALLEYKHDVELFEEARKKAPAEQKAFIERQAAIAKDLELPKPEGAGVH